MNTQIWYADSIGRMEDGIWVERISGEIYSSDPEKAWVPVVRAVDHMELQQKYDKLLNTRTV